MQVASPRPRGQHSTAPSTRNRNTMSARASERAKVLGSIEQDGTAYFVPRAASNVYHRRTQPTPPQLRLRHGGLPHSEHTTWLYRCLTVTSALQQNRGCIACTKFNSIHGHIQLIVMYCTYNCCTISTIHDLLGMLVGWSTFKLTLQHTWSDGKHDVQPTNSRLCGTAIPQQVVPFRSVWVWRHAEVGRVTLPKLPGVSNETNLNRVSHPRGLDGLQRLQ